MPSTSLSPKEETYGLSASQWSLLFVAFFLGIASVFAIDHLFLSGKSFGTVQAATQTP